MKELLNLGFRETRFESDFQTSYTGRINNNNVYVDSFDEEPDDLVVIIYKDKQRIFLDYYVPKDKVMQTINNNTQ